MGVSVGVYEYVVVHEGVEIKVKLIVGVIVEVEVKVGINV